VNSARVFETERRVFASLVSLLFHKYKSFLSPLKPSSPNSNTPELSSSNPRWAPLATIAYSAPILQLCLLLLSNYLTTTIPAPSWRITSTGRSGQISCTISMPTRSLHILIPVLQLILLVLQMLMFSTSTVSLTVSLSTSAPVLWKYWQDLFSSCRILLFVTSLYTHFLLFKWAALNFSPSVCASNLHVLFHLH